MLGRQKSVNILKLIVLSLVPLLKLAQTRFVTRYYFLQSCYQKNVQELSFLDDIVDTVLFFLVLR